ncbi:hypothetical protein LCFBJUUZ_CDS0196 [Staphylococcus phage PG-2021_76]|uniref:Uncharacterized protein n=1 Tax=Mammaliicoccus phage MSShimriz1 TaxID=3230127 RepID=A0AAU8GT77_9VIRU
MTKVTSTHSKGINNNELNMWLEAVTRNTVNGEAITPDQAKHLDRLANRSVSLEEATRIAQTLVSEDAQYTTQYLNQLFNIVDIFQIVMEDELGLTEEQFKKASEKVREKREELLEKEQDKVREASKDAQEEALKDIKEKEVEKVVQMKPKND